MPIEVRAVPEDQLPAYIESISTAFLDPIDADKVAAEVAPLWADDGTWAAFEAERICGTFRSFGTEVTVPGGATLPAAAVAGVTVRPTHRRRGILRAMVETAHASFREDAVPVALLYASEYPIYGRFGYGPAVRLATWTIDAHGTHIAPAGSVGGRVELVRPNAEAKAAIQRVFESWRVRQPGEIRRRDYRWDFELGIRDQAWGPPWRGFLALHHGADGRVDGYARYHVEDKWEQRQPRAILHVDDLHALDDEAYAALWGFLIDVDLVATIRAEQRIPSEPLPWLLTNARAAVVSEVADGMWVRLFDVARALGARTYERDGEIVLEVVDAERPDGRLRVALEAGPDGARCDETDRLPDLTLDVAALGTAWLGGVSLHDAVRRAGVDEHRPGALAETDALLRTAREPWCSTHF